MKLAIPDHLKNAGVKDVYSEANTLNIKYNNKQFVCTLKEKYSTIGEIHSLPERLYYVTGEILDESLVCELSRFVKDSWDILTSHLS